MSVISRKQKSFKLQRTREPSIRVPVTKVAYIMSAFPALTVTFILDEILAMEQFGVTDEIYPLRRRGEHVVHPEVERLLERVQYHLCRGPSCVRSASLFVAVHSHMSRYWLKFLEGRLAALTSSSRRLVFSPPQCDLLTKCSVWE